jgi:hypothetical protein
MTTFTINNPILEKNYTTTEIKQKFLYFIETELKEENIDSSEISVSNDYKNITEFSELSNEDEIKLKNMPEFNTLLKTFS